MRLGVFGGTLNPIHYGHLRAAEEIRQKLRLDGVIFVPTGTPPLKSEELAPASQRYAMAEAAIASNEYFSLSDIECKRQGVSYSIHTAEELRGAHPDDELFFIVGVDAFLELPKWYEPGRLLGLLDFVIMSRPGHSFSHLLSSPYLSVQESHLRGLDKGSLEPLEAPLEGGRTATLLPVTPLGVSASSIRELVRRRMSIKYLLPEQVESFIMSNGLYSG